MKKKSLLVLALTSVLSLNMLTGCGGNDNTSEPETQTSEAAAQETGTTEETGTHTVVDMNGDTVEIGAEPIKIMTCNAVATKTVLMLGGTDAAATLGQGFTYEEGSLNQKMFPGLDGLPLFTRDDANAEEVLSINPAVVLIDVPDIITALRQVNIPTAYVSVTSAETLIDSVRIVGDILGGDAVEKASAYAKYYQGLVDQATSVTDTLTDDERPLVYYGRIEEGTAGKNSIPDFWIQASGGINLASEAGLEGSRVDISDEELIAGNPDIIITETPQLAEIFRTSEKYAALDAVVNGQVYCCPEGWGMGSLESALQMVWAPSIIQPDLFPDNDIAAATKEFYQTYYQYDLSDEELNGLIYPDQQ